MRPGCTTRSNKVPSAKEVRKTKRNGSIAAAPTTNHTNGPVHQGRTDSAYMTWLTSMYRARDAQAG